MADRVHANNSPPSSENSGRVAEQNAQQPGKPQLPVSAKPVPPPPGTYVIQVPKDQIYRYPPPENSRRLKSFSRRKSRRGCCCRCLCYTLCLLVVLIVAVAVAAGVFYLVFRPESPNYTVSDVAIKGLNLTSRSAVSPEFDVIVRAENPNDKIGIYYRKGSSVRVFYSGIELSHGELPAFFQPSNNVTDFHTALKGSGVLLGNTVRSSLVRQQRQRKVTFKLDVEAPVKIKVGAVKTWEITVKVKCDVTVDALNEKSNVVSKDCNYSVKLW
nr:protein YLS9-like [Ipomoea batatas]